MRVLFTIGFIVELLAGLALVAVPERVVSVLALEVGAPAMVVLKLYGSTRLGLAVLLWMGRRARGRDIARVVLLTVFVAGATTSTFLVLAQLEGLMNPLGWGVIDVQALLTVAYGFYLFKPRTNGIG